MDQVINESEESAIDAALVEVIRIFAARGRAIREERERAKRNQELSESVNGTAIMPESVSNEPNLPPEQCNGKYAGDHATVEQPSIETLESLSENDSASAMC